MRCKAICKAKAKTADDKNMTQSLCLTLKKYTKIPEINIVKATKIICPTSKPKLKPNKPQPIDWSFANIIRTVFAKPIPCIRPKNSAK